MKILLLSGASSIHTIRWANGLAEIGHEVHLVTQQLPIEPLSKKVTVHQFKNRGIVGYYLLARAVKKIIKNIQPDVLNAHYASGYGTTARLVNWHPYVLSVWGADVYEFPDKSVIHRNLIKKNVLAADLVASTSHCMGQRVKEVVGEELEIEITPFGVDTSKFKPTENNKGGAPFVIGTVKVLAKKYGIDILIQAFAKFIEEYKLKPESSRLRIVGKGPEEQNLKALVDSLSISDYVDFVGRVPHDQVPIELNKMDVYAALSRFDGESFGVAVIEASACGIPVVVSDVGGLPEVVKDKITGYVVNREDLEVSSKAISYLYANPKIRHEMSKVSSLHVQDNYSWLACIDKMLLAYSRAIQKCKR